MFHLPLLLAQDVASSIPSANTESFFGLGTDELVVLIVAIGCTTVVLIVATVIISAMVGSVHRRNAEYDLKREMLDRGMTAEEISQVIEATPLPQDGVGRWIASWGKCGKTRKQNL
ncbi:MAG: hypothetical protein GXP26_06350 [Planctomycetes bacterium]|nr:hypothetical protein [Planctomycetota bacterium]